jgi:hypothetical protein
MRTSFFVVALVADAAFLVGQATAPGAAPAAPSSRVFMGRLGDAFGFPPPRPGVSSAQREEARGRPAGHTPLARARYSVVFYRDNLFVYRYGRPDNPVFSARGGHRTGDGGRRLGQRSGMSLE